MPTASKQAVSPGPAPTPAPFAPSCDPAALRAELEAALAGEVRFDAVSRALYANDASVYEIVPLGVVLPKTRDDVVRLVQIAGRHRCPITARGGGTSQAGQAIGPGLVVDFSKYLNRVLEVDPQRRRVRVEPGVVQAELNAALRPHGLQFPIDLSTANRATLGGMMANNSSGTRSIVYGKTVDHVIEQTVVLADGSVAVFGDLSGEKLDAACAGDSLAAAAHRVVRRLATEHAGEIERRYPKLLRRVGGYNLDEFTPGRKPFNLSRLMVGSEGTLGIVVEATLNVVPIPKAKVVLAIHFAGLLDALAAVPLILRRSPSAVEVTDKFILDGTRTNAAFHRLRDFIVGDPGALLYVEFAGDRADELLPRLDRLERDLAEHKHGYHCFRAIEPSAQARIWSLREASLGLSMAARGDAKALSFVEDTAVSSDRLRDYIERFLQIVHKHGTVAGVYAHASVGCLHVRPVVNLKTQAGVEQFAAISDEIADLVLEFGGALSGEHGDGLLRSAFLPRMFGPVLTDAFGEIKRTFDPAGIFNPGKIVDAPPNTANLRFGPGYVTPEAATHFDFSEYGGMARAVEMCSGVGACRKKLDGTMCPSYVATLEETHVTRGRANVLRLAMNGRLASVGLTDHDVHAALDLCLECRACTAECPVGVDMARMKSEFLAGYRARHGTPASAKLLGGIAGAAKWGSRLAPVSNWLAGSRAARRVGEWLFGIDRRREPPTFRRRTFRKRFAARPGRAGTGLPAGGAGLRARRVVLFVDTFTNHIEPEIGIAAAELLEAAGFAVEIAEHGCCGRPMISQGLLHQAREAAERNAAALADAAGSGATIVFCEPSCLSAVREDAPALLRGDIREKARRVAGASMLLEEFLENELAAGRARLDFASGPSKVLLHGHCHQKAMGLLPAAVSLLGRVPGCAVVEPDAGCCGMAGSFGYMRGHYDLSRTIAERKLIPAVRGLEPGTPVAAAGTSCRAQIAHFAGRAAVHPAVLLRSLLREK